MLTRVGKGDPPVGTRIRCRAWPAMMLAALLGLTACMGEVDQAIAQIPSNDSPYRPLQLPTPPTGLGNGAPGRTLAVNRPGRDLVAEAAAAKEKTTPADVKPEKDLTPTPTAMPLPGELALVPIKPKSQISAESGRYIKQVSGPNNTLEIIVGRLQIFDLMQPPKRLQIGDESVANYALLSTNELSLQGLRVGSTVLNIWFNEPGSKQGKLISFLVRVLPDPEARERLERAYKNLEKEINRILPDSRIRLELVGDKLTVKGQAKDIAEANMIMRLVQANVLREPADSPDLGRPASGDVAVNTSVLPIYHRQVVNMIRVIGEQQIMLQVQVVEVDRAAARSVGLNFGAFRTNGSFFVGGTTANLAATRTGSFVPFTTQAINTGLTGLGGLPNLPVALDYGQIQLAIAGLRSVSYARYLAEPNLVAINGQTANFQVGGLLPIPVISGSSVSNIGGVNFVPTGVQLAFTPFITDRDRVRLAISAEISDRDLNVSPTIIEGAAIPSLTTRNFRTTVELREGQTLAVAGLIENKLDADSSGLPFFHRIPILGRIAGYDRIGNREKELVILVTPRLVRPMECGEVPPLPGTDILEPTDYEFYVLGRLESHTGMDFRSPIRTDNSRYKQFREMERSMLSAPCGPSMDLPSGPMGPVMGGPSDSIPVLPGNGVPGGTLPAPMVPGAVSVPNNLPAPIVSTNRPAEPPTSQSGTSSGGTEKPTYLPAPGSSKGTNSPISTPLSRYKM